MISLPVNRFSQVNPGQYWTPDVLRSFPWSVHTGLITMNLDPSDVLFIALVLWIAIVIINNSGGGGHRARVPAGA